ncbi:MAG: NAD(P)H-binding protein [Chloroflexota bacterium]
MTSKKLHAVTGAFGFSGKNITKLLLAEGHDVITLTGNPARNNPFGKQLKVSPFQFDDPDALAGSLRGVDTLFNTYWIRFNHGDTTFEKAVANTSVLVDAAKIAGVRKIVHVSITNPDINSTLPYFSGKAKVEQLIKDAGISYAFLRPAVIFGTEGILINNIAWMLRLFPFLPVPGNGEYKLQPIYVEDLAKLAVSAGEQKENQTIDAIGPDTFNYNEMVRVIATNLGRPARLIHLPPILSYIFSKPLGYLMGDIVLTKDEVTGLLNNNLTTDSQPAGTTKLSDWVADNADWLGKHYFSELKMHY